MRNYRYFTGLLTLVNDENNGTVWVDDDDHDRYSFDFNERERSASTDSLEFAHQVLKEAGAKRVFHTGVLSTHVQGSCRMGSDPARSVVDAHGESHDVRRLFVGDSSVVPRTLSVNPSLTIMALASRLAAVPRTAASTGTSAAPERSEPRRRGEPQTLDGRPDRRRGTRGARAGAAGLQRGGVPRSGVPRSGVPRSGGNRVPACFRTRHPGVRLRLSRCSTPTACSGRARASTSPTAPAAARSTSSATSAGSPTPPTGRSSRPTTTRCTRRRGWTSSRSRSCCTCRRSRIGSP